MHCLLQCTVMQQHIRHNQLSFTGLRMRERITCLSQPTSLITLGYICVKVAVAIYSMTPSYRLKCTCWIFSCIAIRSILQRLLKSKNISILLKTPNSRMTPRYVTVCCSLINTICTSKQKEHNKTYCHLPQTVYKIYRAARTTHNHKTVKAVYNQVMRASLS